MAKIELEAPNGGGSFSGDAVDVTFTPAGSVASTDVQAAIEEVSGDADAAGAGLVAHLADGTDAHDASAISVADSGNHYTGTDVEAVLAEIAASLGAATGLTLDETPNADTSANGVTIPGVAGEALSFGDPVYIKSDGKMGKADADTAGTFPVLGICILAAANNGATSILLLGVARNDAWNWTVGGLIYLSTSSGLTQTQPSATDNAIQPLGYALTADIMLVLPQTMYLTHA